jgi:hypothetical protein
VEPLDAQVLLDPLEEQLDLPAVPIERRDGEDGKLEVVGQEDQRLAGLRIPITDPAQGRWCTSGAEYAMPPSPCGYAMTGFRRTEFGRPTASIRFKTSTPMAASVCWAAKPRARSRTPITAL